MVWKVTRNTVIFLLVIIFFILILLLPKEMEMEGLGGLRFQANYPFTLELYEKNITEFISHFQTDINGVWYGIWCTFVLHTK